jgi:hypothetical protein
MNTVTIVTSGFVGGRTQVLDVETIICGFFLMTKLHTFAYYCQVGKSRFSTFVPEYELRRFITYSVQPSRTYRYGRIDGLVAGGQRIEA